MVIVIIAIWVGIFYGCYFLFAKSFFSNEASAFLLSGLIGSLSALGVLFFFIKKNLDQRKAAIILISCVVADIGINQVIRNIQDTSSYGLLHCYAGINLALLGVALCGGFLLGSIIKKPSYIIPLAAAAGLADIWSVAFGVTNKIIQSRETMNFLLFSFPVPGKGILPIIGVTDFVFATMFISLSYRFNIPVIRTLALVAASFILSITIAAVGGFGVPVLPVMGVLFIVGHYKYVRIDDPKEKSDAVRGILIIATALAVLTLIRFL